MDSLVCRPVQSDGAKAEHRDGAVDLLEELDSLAHHQSVEPPAAAGTDPEGDVEGNTHQARADPRARQVLDEAAGDRFKDAGGAGAPQHCGVACGRRDEDHKFYSTLIVVT